MRHGLSVLLALGLAACTPEGGGIPPVGLDLYILAGQSNMVGGDHSVSPRFAHEDKVWLFGNDLKWHRGQEPTDDPFVPVQPYPVNQSVNPGVSPGMAFADAMVGYNGRAVGLIPCAHGGSTIAQWQPNDSTGSLYGACMAMVRQAFPMGRVRGILFWQGESDTATKEQVRAWTAGFKAVVAGMREEIGDPSLPVVFAQIGPNSPDKPYAWPEWTGIQAVQAAISERNVAMIVTKDLPMNPNDGVHVSAVGMLKAGQRFAEKMVELVD